MFLTVFKLWLLVWFCIRAEESCATNLVQQKALRRKARFAEPKSISNLTRGTRGGRKPWDVYDYLTGLHHKSGVLLFSKLWQFIFQVLGAQDEDIGFMIKPCYWHSCRNTDAPILTMEDMCSPEILERQKEAARKKGKGLFLAGPVRDPVSMLGSAYCYHRRSTEPLNVMFFPPGWPAVTIATMEMEDAVMFIAERLIPSMENMTSLYEKPDKNCFRLDYEKATGSSAGFDEVVRKMLDAMFGDMISKDQKQECLEAASWADLRRHPETFDYHSNQDDGCEAEAVQLFLSKASPDLVAKYHSYQQRLGYPLS